ncbi:hypothetical protein SAMN04487995_1553 [Dyadobacter koreensis]|uniref:Uncharacterized protein n=1 Tax=Dyadobacter koreensis TaxID=408657 RepID=A0A1H6S813_9BACT|nr:hypothetical protein [Dyadobacter koreensis]SEI59562.1 hypothetical protein SAMN04487995_1553 [Dyadobacter koreensis]
MSKNLCIPDADNNNPEQTTITDDWKTLNSKSDDNSEDANFLIEFLTNFPGKQTFFLTFPY